MLNKEVVVVGSYVEDVTWRTDQLPFPGETRMSDHHRTGQGGKGFNQAVACSRQNVDTYFIGAIGNDDYGRQVQDFVSKEKFLKPLFYHDPDHPTGAAGIFVDKKSGQNLIAVFWEPTSICLCLLSTRSKTK